MMKCLITVIALSICLGLVASKGSDKTYPKKVKISKPTKGPKSPVDEFASLPPEDLEFIKELDKQFKMHGDKIKIKVERDNSTAKNSKRTIEGDLGYGNQNGIQQPRFQFSKPKYSIYPYSQRDIPPIPLHNGALAAKAPYHSSSFQVQRSNAFEIKESPGSYQAFNPTHQPFHSQYTPKPPVFPTPEFYNHFNQNQNLRPYEPYHTSTPQIQQQYNEPVIVLRIPGPAKYAAHLQTLLQRYLEIRAAQYIKAFEEHEARVEQQQALLRQKQQHEEPQLQHQYNQPIQSTDYYRPYSTSQFSKPQSYSSSTPDAPYQQQQYQRPIYTGVQHHRPKEYSIQIQEPHQQQYSIPKTPQIQDYVPIKSQSHGFLIGKAPQPQEYLVKAPQQQEYLAPKSPEPQQEYQIPNVQQTQDYVISKPQAQEYSAPKVQQEQYPAEEEEEVEEPEIPEARHRPQYSKALASGEVQEDENHQLFSYDNEEQTEMPAAQSYRAHQAMYLQKTPSPSYLTITDKHQLQKEPVPHKVYGVPPSSDAEKSLPTNENSPRLTHTQVLFNNDAKPEDHSSSYPLPPISSTTPKYDYQKHNYETDEQEQSYNGAPDASVVTITQRPRGPFNYHAHSSLETDFQGDAPYTQSQFKKLNDLIDRLKARSPQFNTNTSDA